MFPSQKQTKTRSVFWTTIFLDKFIFWRIRISITSRRTSLLLISSIHLVFSPLEIQIRLLKTKYTARFVSLSGKKGLTNLPIFNLRSVQSPCFTFFETNDLKEVRILLFLFIRRLQGCSIVNWGYQGNFKPVTFLLFSFFTKKSLVDKNANQAKTN